MCYSGMTYLFGLRQGLFLPGNLPSRLGWPAVEPQGSCLSLTPIAGITRACHFIWWVLSIDSGPHGCKAGILLSELFPQPG